MRKPHHRPPNPPRYDPETEFERHVLHRIETLELTVSDLSDRIATLTSAVADNTTATNAAVDKINAGPGAPSDAADVAAAVTALDSANTQIAANTDALNGAAPPAA